MTSEQATSSRNLEIPRPKMHPQRPSVDILPPDGETLVSAEAPVSAAVADLLAYKSRSNSPSRLRDFVPYTDTADDEVRDDFEDGDDSLPPKSFSKPSPWWILILMSIAGFVTSLTLAPRTEVYIRLVCAQHKPELMLPFLPPSSHHSNNGTEPPLINVEGLFASNSSGPNMVSIIPNKDGGYDAYIPRPNARCTADPDVGRVVAGLTTAVALALGMCSMLTTGFWSNFSDRVGRRKIMGIGILGLIMADLVFIFTAHHSHRLPGGYNFFILGSIIDGLAGGVPTATAASHAYVSDCTDPASRAKFFSYFLGMLFVGMSVGPTLGGYLVTQTGDMLSVFYVAFVTHVAFALVIWTLLPESLPPHVLQANQDELDATKSAIHDRREARLARESTTITDIIHKRVWWTIKSLASFVTPLGVFLPRKRQIGEPGYERGGRDWNLTCIGLASALNTTMVSINPFKFQYAEAAFGWTSEELGIFLTSVGALRSLHLMFLLPFLLSFFAPTRKSLRDQDHRGSPDDDPRRPLLAPHRRNVSAISQTPSVTPSHSDRIKNRHVQHSAHLDLSVTRISLFIECASYALISLSMNQKQFFSANMLASFGTGFGPGLQALGLFFMPRGNEDAGKLFGALGMVQALSSQIIGPSLYGATYIATVSVFPKAIFVVATTAIFGGFLATTFVRLPPKSQ